MGAIVLSNYVASYGKECALDGAISLSGGLDMRFQENFERAKRYGILLFMLQYFESVFALTPLFAVLLFFFFVERLWQPMLAESLRSDFMLGKWGKRVHERLSKDEMLCMMRATHITVSSV
jgi:hypothetical protein